MHSLSSYTFRLVVDDTCDNIYCTYGIDLSQGDVGARPRMQSRLFHIKSELRRYKKQSYIDRKECERCGIITSDYI